MASNLSTIGFAFDDESAFSSRMVELAADARERLVTNFGEYAIWRSRSGAELWFQLAPAGDGDEVEIIGLTPFFEGQSEVKVTITELNQREDDTPLEGAMTAWVTADEDDQGLFPLVAEAVDFAAHAERELPLPARVRVVGFAREVAAYASTEDYQASQTHHTKLADQSFFPMGLFSAAMEGEGEEDGAGEEDGRLAASSTALLTGRVVEHRTLINEATGRSFHWLLVDSLELRIDVVADPEVIEGEIVDGGTVEVACMLFARLVD